MKLPEGLRRNGLWTFFAVLFVLALAGQAVAGFIDHNNQQIADGAATLSLGAYLTSSDFATDVAENWQSEYLQFFLYIVMTVWLVQRGSPESKPLDDAGTESDQAQRIGPHAGPDSPRWARRGGAWTWWYSNSLGLVMLVIFGGSWLAQSIAGRAAYNGEQINQLQDPISWASYLGSADFWSRTLQNWQSEFLAIASMAVLSIYLRQRGSPESKPVGASHAATSLEG
ncbi:DUF6766 family protein [Pseudonocardia sp.]|uniref:DUF6766 family protein n=1 Tax=Pseudonocardia sp. TaxID=60912 RepID=UPI003D11CCD8